MELPPNRPPDHPPPNPAIFRFMLNFLLILALIVGVLWFISYRLTPTPVGPAAAPLPSEHPGALVRIYGADVWGLRGRFAVHTWIATKAPDAASYTTYQVLGWHLRRRGTVLSVTDGAPDTPWFGSQAILLYERSGDSARGLVDAIDRAARSYPYADRYTMWPGPNSNSFTQWVISQVPELEAVLPQKAIGKNWLLENIDDAQALAAKTKAEPSGE